MFSYGFAQVASLERNRVDLNYLIKNHVGIFSNILGNRKLKLDDPHFGKIESDRVEGSKVVWKIDRKFIDADIAIYIEGTKSKIAPNQKKILIEALNFQAEVKHESEQALKKEFALKTEKFTSIEDYVIINSIIVNDNGFKLKITEKEAETPLEILFKNNKQVRVTAGI